jgi:hypothetical protein
MGQSLAFEHAGGCDGTHDPLPLHLPPLQAVPATASVTEQSPAVQTAVAHVVLVAGQSPAFRHTHECVAVQCSEPEQSLSLSQSTHTPLGPQTCPPFPVEQGAGGVLFTTAQQPAVVHAGAWHEPKGSPGQSLTSLQGLDVEHLGPTSFEPTSRGASMTLPPSGPAPVSSPAPVSIGVPVSFEALVSAARLSFVAESWPVRGASIRPGASIRALPSSPASPAVAKSTPPHAVSPATAAATQTSRKLGVRRRRERWTRLFMGSPGVYAEKAFLS